MTLLLGRLLAGAAALLAAAALAQAPTEPIPVPQLTGPVIDFTGTLSAADREALEAKLRAFESARGSQVAVLLVPSIGSETIEEFAGRVADQWSLGRKGVDDGVLFVVAMQERRMRIHTGRGVQGTLTDLLSKRIVADIVAPKFRSGDFVGGIREGVDAILKAIEGEELPLPSKPPAPKVDTLSSYGNLLILGLFLVPLAASILRGMFGRFLGAGITGGVTGVAVAFLLGSIAIAIVAGIIAFVFGLLGASGIPTRGTRGGHGGGWGGGWGGGGFGGGGGWSGGGGGGWSGGGGTFDGGGASGGW